MTINRDVLLLVIALPLTLVGLFLSIDFFSAILAQPCGAPNAGASCYPWGAEGPAGNDWQYSSRTLYLVSGAAIILLPVATAAFVGWNLICGQALSTQQRSIAAMGLAIAIVLLIA